MSIILLLPVLSFGYLFVNLLSVKQSVIFKVSVGYLLGIGLFTFIIFLFNLIGVPYERNSTAFVLISLIVLTFALNKFVKNPIIPKSPYSKFSILEKLLIGGLMFFVLSSLIYSLYEPVKDWDSLVLYDFRAKIFVESGFYTEDLSRSYYFGYPLLTSLIHTWVYVWGNFTPLPAYSLYYTALLGLFYSCLSITGIKREMSLFFTLILGAIPIYFEHSLWAYTNLPYAVYLSGGLALGYVGIKNKETPFILLSAFFVGLSTWTRFVEPFWIVITVFTVLFAFIIKNSKAAILYPIVVYMFRIPWSQFVFANTGNQISNENLVTSLVGATSHLNVANQTEVLGYINQYLIQPYFYIYLLFIISLPLSALLIIKKREISLLYLLLIISGSIFAIVYGTFLFSSSFQYWNEIGDSARRMSMFIVPFILFYVAILTIQSSKRINRKL